MCNAWSGLVKKSGEVIWKFGVDSHETLIASAKLSDQTDDPEKMMFARVEISPENKDYLNPYKWVFKLDEHIKPSWWSDLNEKHCWQAQEKWLTRLNKILVHKPIIHPFLDVTPPKKITKKHIDLLKKWDSVGYSVRDSVGAYFGSFFRLPRKAWKHTEKIKCTGYPFQPTVDLWEMGLVPSFDGTTWRLHGGKDGKVLWEGKINGGVK